MYEISCARAGHHGCKGVIRAGSEDELKARLIEHARVKHNLQGMTDTIYNYLRSTAHVG
ncbi:MAG: DUF1059 domain-containing protein [Acidimicrobiales bacterium]